MQQRCAGKVFYYSGQSSDAGSYNWCLRCGSLSDPDGSADGRASFCASGLYDDSDTAVVLLDTNFSGVDANRSGESLFAGPDAVV